jgi:predicted ATP-dependent serine protease
VSLDEQTARTLGWPGPNGEPEMLSTTRESALVERNNGLPFRPLRQALKDVPPEPDWVWDGYLAPGSVTLEAGKPKVGKSTTTFGALDAIGRGEPFLGRVTRQTRSLLLSEERHGTLADKAERFGLEQTHLLMRAEVGDCSWPEVVAEASDYCQVNEIGLLVVDVWDKWIGLRGSAENDSGSVLEALGPLEAAAASGLAVLVVAHQRKAQGTHGEAVRGNNALTGGVDVIVEVERLGDSDPSARVLRASSRYSATPEELVFVRTEDGFDVADREALALEADRKQLVAVGERLRRAGKEEPTAAEFAQEVEGCRSQLHVGGLWPCPTSIDGGRGRRTIRTDSFFAPRPIP